MKTLTTFLILILLIFSSQAYSQINQALTATSSHSGGGSGAFGPSNYNDDQIAATTSGASGWVSTNGWIEYNWNDAVLINSLVFYKGNRPMTSAEIQYWNGTEFITFYNYSSTAIQIKDSISFSTIVTNRLRINKVAGSSNPNHREIQAIYNTKLNDVSVFAIDSPMVFCAGNKDIYATIANLGSNQIDSVEIHWDFNGTPQNVIMQYLLDTVGGTNPYSSMVYLGNKLFTNGVANTITVWTEQPNNTTDSDIWNDTLEVQRQAAMTGSYTLDASLPAGSGNYQSFTSLADDLNTIGLCGPVTVTVAAGTYEEYFHLNEIPGSSTINTLTIDGVDSSSVILTHDSSSSLATVTLNGADYVTLKNITIERIINGTQGVAMILSNGADHNIISNNELRVDQTSTSSNVSNIVFSGSSSSISTAALANYNTISNNLLLGGYYGIRMYAASNNVNVNNHILNNELKNIYYYGIQAYYQDSLLAEGNQIDVSSRENLYSYGINVSYSNNTLLLSNNVKASNYGIYFYNYDTYSLATRKIELSNNMVISNGYGIYMSYVDSSNLYHNSISSTSASPAMYMSGSGLGDYDVRNNIFSSLHGTAFQSNEGINIFDKFENNAFFTKDSPVLITIDGNDYADLNAFKAAYPQFNQLSVEGNPLFLSFEEDLHIVGNLVNDAGDNAVGVNVDIDSDSRPITGSTIVDIGADEFNPPSCPPPYDLSATDPALDSITLAWTAGTGTFQYEIVLKGNSLGSGDTASTTSDSLRIGGLSAATAYEYYVREICGRGDTSIWRGPLEFYTADSIIYFEDFESFTNGELKNGWKSSTYSAPIWKSATSTTYGPKEDHTIGAGGTFSFLDSDYGTGSSTLLSPMIYVGNNTHLELSFWYHMYGAEMGDLEVYVDSNGVSNILTIIQGQQQDIQSAPWKEFSTYLTGYEGKYIQLRLIGAKNIPGYESEMAIDDVKLDTIPEFNAGVVSLISPQGAICAGSFSPVVGVRNLGRRDVDSVKVLWEINGVLQDSVMYSNTIVSGDTASVTLNNISFNSTSFYDLKIYTKDPNSSTDPFPVDDTLLIEKLRTGLAGNYTIDPSSATSFTNFTTINDAIDELNTYGVCGAVNFDVSSGTYNEAVVINEIDGSSASNTITFDGGDSSLTTLSHDGSVNYASWIFDEASYIIVKNMGIESSGMFQAVAVQLTNGASNITLSNNNIEITSTVSTTQFVAVLFAGKAWNTPAENVDSNTISNNNISGGYYGIYMYASTFNLNSNNKLLGNTISNIYHTGISTSYQDSLEIIGNHVDMSGGYSNSQGVQANYTVNNIFHENYVLSESAAVFFISPLTSSRKSSFVNNMLISDKSYGLYIQYLDSADILHNSVSVESISSAVRIHSIGSYPLSNYDVRNNIFSAVNAKALDVTVPSTLFSNLDNNLYYSQNSILMSVGGNDYADLAVAQAAMPQFNANSLEGDPQFESADDLHIVGTFVNDQGDNTVGVTRDIDGDTRPIVVSGTVDIGADEFNPPSCPPVLNITASNPTDTSIVIQWEGGSGYFEYEIVMRGDTLGTGMRDTTLLDSLEIKGLSQLTDYDIYVREICGAADTSIWWGPIDFNTIIMVYDLSLSAILNPVALSDTCYTSTNNVELLIVNTGNFAIDFTIDTTETEVNVSGAVTQIFSNELNDNSLNNGQPLAVGDSLILSMGNLDLTSIGSYDIESYINFKRDTLNFNDTLTRTIVNVPEGGSLSASDVVCGSSTIELFANNAFGELQWQRFVGGNFVDEAGADSISHVVFIDSTTTFRVVACGTDISDTLVVTAHPIPAAPSTISDTAIVFCGDSATAILSANSVLAGASFNWYNDSSNTIPIAQADSLYYGLNTGPQSTTTTYTDTFYVSVVDSISACESQRSMVTGTVICTVGEEQIPSSFEGLSIYPNPSNGIFNLVGSNIGEDLHITVYSATGKIVHHINTHSTKDFEKKINLSGMSKGVYFVKIQSEKSNEMRKIILN